MRFVLAVVAAFFLAPLAPAGAAENLTAFVGATLIDGNGGEPLADSVVVVRGERIAAVAARRGFELPDGAEVVDVAGKWIIPGLIDAHIHFFQSGGLYTRPDIVDLRTTHPYAAELAAIRARLSATFARYLASGVTSVIDVGGPFWTFEARDLARETRLAPRVAVAGPLLGTYAPPELASDDPAIIRVPTRDAAHRQVRRLLAGKPDLIKLWLVVTPGLDLASEFKWVRAAIDEAHAAGVRVFAHATEREVARAAVRHGVDVLAHSVGDRILDHASLAFMRRRGVVYTATLMVDIRYREVLGQALALSEIERRLGDAQAIASFADVAALPAGAVPSWARRSPSATANDIAFANLRRVQAAGITVAAGSDAGNIGTLHGPSLHRELELMVEAGLKPAEAIVAATRGSARAMGRADDLGTVEEGKLADLVVLDGDPLRDIRNTRAIDRVVKGGEVFDPDEIMAEALAGDPSL